MNRSANTLCTVVLSSLALALVSVRAQSQQPVPIRTLAPASARSTQTVGAIASLRDIPIVDGLVELPGRRVLISDQVRSQLLLLDSSLKEFTILADAAGTSGTKYPPGLPSLIPYLADTVLLLEPATRSLLVIKPSGHLEGTWALPHVQDFNLIMNNGAWVDARGGLLYTAFVGYPSPVLRRANMTTDQCPTYDWSQNDSATVLRADINTRRVDTVARFRSQRWLKAQIILGAKDKLVCAQEPLYAAGFVADAWIATSDGSVAIIRGHDYHVDWIAPDGSRVSGSKLPFDWRRLTDAEKEAQVGVAQKLIDSLAATGFKNEVRYCGVTTGGGDMRVTSAADAVRGAPITPLPPMRDDFTSCQIGTLKLVFAPMAQMPDYYPPIRPGAVTADRDGNVWILPTTSLAAASDGGRVYDVINRQHGLMERVRVPLNRQIAGFGPGGVVYLSWRDASGGWIVERTRVQR